MNRQLLLQLLALFAITQALGLFVGKYLIEQNIHTTIVSVNPDAVENGLGLVAWIMLFTAVLLVAIKLFSDRKLYILLKALEALAIFGSALVVMLPFNLSDLASFVLALALVAARILRREDVMLRNISSMVAAAGAGALIGVSIGVLPILVFLLLMAAYDFIAVFKTKHMVVLAKSLAKKNLSFTYAMPTVKEARQGSGAGIVRSGEGKNRKKLVKGRQFELGTGDMVVPLAFAVSVFAAAWKTIAFPYSLLPAVAILDVSLLGLMFTVEQVSLKPGRALPALPVQVILMTVAFGVMKAFGRF